MKSSIDTIGKSSIPAGQAMNFKNTTIGLKPDMELARTRGQEIKMAI